MSFLIYLANIYWIPTMSYVSDKDTEIMVLALINLIFLWIIFYSGLSMLALSTAIENNFCVTPHHYLLLHSRK